ncbi:MFS transporter [Pseudokineococcus basanitobsidens]|uniref:MFS transporter n=1 Tax=Pseudokineococcus basanitobsidens TaxID=1926649 RepID=A0ABU8RLM6_9ACTN
MKDATAPPPAGPTGGAHPAASPREARSVLAGVLVATLLVSLDLLAVAAAVPELALDLELERAVALPVGASVLGVALAVPAAARACARGPRAWLLALAAVLLVVGGVAVALAPVPDGAAGDDPGSLLAVGLGRLVQGLGAGGLVVGAGSALATTVPAALQVRVQAALVLVTGAGAVLGALVGGVLAGVPGGWRAVPLLAPALAVVALVLLRPVRSRPVAAAPPAPAAGPSSWSVLRHRVVLLGAVVGGAVGAVAVLALVQASLLLALEQPLPRGLLLAAGVLAGLAGVVGATTAIARVGRRPHLAQVGTAGAVVAAVGVLGLAWLVGPGRPASVVPLVLVGLGLGAVVQGTGLVVSVLCPEGAEREAAAALGAARRIGGVVGAVVVLLVPLLGSVDGVGPTPQGVLTPVVGVGGALLLLALVPVLGVLPRRGDVRHPARP